jgi:HSP20 family protein
MKEEEIVMFDLVPFRKRNQDVVRQVFNSFNDIFNDDFFAPMRGDTYKFLTDIRETEDAYVIESELPGFDKGDISVDYANHYLTIKAVQKQDHEQKDDNYKVIRRERYVGEYVRRFYVEDIDDQNIEGKYKDGLLTLTVPKRSKQEQVTRRIEIQ